MNISFAIDEGIKILKEKSIITASLDAEILMAQAINKDRKFILLNLNKRVNKNHLNNFQKLIKNRSRRIPVAYLTNKKFFWNSEFIVSNKTLIPRPDTELIVENVLNLTKSKNKLNILDIGIGSGCILLSILKEKQNFYGTGIDVSKNCLNISKINAINLNVSSRLKRKKAEALQLGEQTWKERVGRDTEPKKDWQGRVRSLKTRVQANREMASKSWADL